MKRPRYRETSLRSFRYQRAMTLALPYVLAAIMLPTLLFALLTKPWELRWLIVISIAFLVWAWFMSRNLVTEVRLISPHEAEFVSRRRVQRLALREIYGMNISPWSPLGVHVLHPDGLVLLLWGAPGMFALVNAVRAANPSVRISGERWLVA